MGEVLTTVSSLYTDLISAVPAYLHDPINVLILSALIVLFTLFVWVFYRSLGKRDILYLNLHQYNKSEHPVLSKIGATFFYFIEYVVIMPIIISLWAFALSVFIMLIAQSKSTFQIITLTTAMVLAIRFLSYEKEAIAKELAKLFPFISLSVFLLSADALKFKELIARVGEIPDLVHTIGYLFVLILIVEVVLRLFYTIKEFFTSEDERKIEWWLLPPRGKD